MKTRSSKSLSLSRRDLFQVSGALAASSTATGPSPGHQFETWEADRVELESRLDRLGDADVIATESLLGRSFELEQLILLTPCTELLAVRVKARLLVWLMEMEEADGLAAMRHIRAYLEKDARS